MNCCVIFDRIVAVDPHRAVTRAKLERDALRTALIRVRVRCLTSQRARPRAKPMMPCWFVPCWKNWLCVEMLPKSIVSGDASPMRPTVSEYALPVH